jgi:hypothetical protein
MIETRSRQRTEERMSVFSLVLHRELDPKAHVDGFEKKKKRSMAIRESTRRPKHYMAVKKRNRGWRERPGRPQERVWWVCAERSLMRTVHTWLCYSYLIINAFSSYPAVGGRGSGESARRFRLPWTARIHTTRRAKAGIGSFRSPRFARDLVKMPH